MNRGHLSADFLSQQLSDPTELWRLKTDSPTASGHRDACLGNGLIGVRINAWGDASGYTPGSGSFMSGLWGAATDNPSRPQGLVELPHWATLTVSGGDRELRRSERDVTNHTQTVDLKTATVETSWTELNIGSILHQKRTAWMARADRHIGVISVEGKIERLPESERTYGQRRIFIDEYLDSLHIPDTTEENCWEDGEDICLELVSKKFGHRLVIRSRILIEGLPAEAIASNTSTSDRVVRRRLLVSGTPWDESWRVTKVVAIVSSKQEANPVAASKAFLDSACSDLAETRKNHVEAWESLWESRIESDNPRLQQIANSCLYHLYSTLRSDLEESHGPCGIVGNGWDANVFWDTELWTFPAITALHPELGRSCVAYRHNTLAGARKNATDNTEEGARFAWQSGETGEEACSVQVFQDERHIVSCVAYAQWLYAMTSGDEEWLKGRGLEVITGCAAYWAGKASFDEEDGKWHILNVCGSDEHAGYVNDNATTNWGAAWTLRTASTLLKELGEIAPPEWEIIADGLLIPWDKERDIPLQMREWEHGQTIKQADTTLLIHPWHYPMDAATKERTVEYYRSHYQSNPIMMGYAIDGIIDCQLGRVDSTTETLKKMVEYFRAPFLISTEAVTNERLPFLTGMGGFLQFLINGFAGLRLDLRDKLSSEGSCLPEGVNELKLVGVHHGGKQHTVTVSRTGSSTSETKIEEFSN